MKIQIWEIRLYYSFFDVLFNNYEKIKEYYIPDLNKSFNFFENDVHIFETNINRYSTMNTCHKKMKSYLIKEYEMNNKEEKMFKNFIKLKNS
jgi:hypothetical protein